MKRHAFTTGRRLLVLATYPSEDASRRLRIDPLVVKANSINAAVSVHTLLPNWAFRRKNRALWRPVVGCRLLVGLIIRVFRLLRLRGGDIVLIHREAFPFFTPWAERLCSRRAGAVILDIDDALHLRPTHVNDWRSLLRDPKRYLGVFPEVTAVFAGSPHMREVALRAGAPTAILAFTCPPTYAFRASMKIKERSRLLWTGSYSTLGSLQRILAPVLRACERTGAKLIVLGGKNVDELPEDPHLEAHPWSQALETSELERCSIGLMPLPDSSGWEEGKSAYKALLYMAAGVVPVVSPVGMNVWLSTQCSGIVTTEEVAWEGSLNSLLSDPEGLQQRGRICATWARQHVRSEQVVESELEILAPLL